MTEFSDLGLSPTTLQAVADTGYTTATPIQAQAIPVALAGQDVLGIAQTGTGKTAAFTLPLIDRLQSGRAKARMPRALVIAPTRELADQVAAPAKTSTPTQTAAADVSITASLTTASINTTSNGTDGSTTTSSPDAKPKREFHDDLLPDAWLEEGIRRSWTDWTLLNGGPAHLLSQKTGRVGLERSLEKYFSVWAWSWDLEAATNAGSTKQHRLFTECIQAYPVVPRGPRERIEELMRSDAAQRLQREREMIVLSDTQLLWPPSDAGCFDDPRDADAAATLGRCYPDREIVLVDARPIFECGGGIHCITQQQPKAGA